MLEHTLTVLMALEDGRNCELVLTQRTSNRLLLLRYL